MICDEAFMSSRLDIPLKSEQFQNVMPKYTTAVAYITNEIDDTWSKRIDLDSLDRASLSSLLVFIQQFQRIGYARSITKLENISFNEKIVKYLLRKTWCNVTSIPQSVYLNDNYIYLNYKRSVIGSIYDLITTRNGRGLNLKAIAAITARIVCALVTLHNARRLHLAIRTQHILLMRGSDMANDELTVLFCGLGSLIQIPSETEKTSSRRVDLPVVELSWRGTHGTCCMHCSDVNEIELNFDKCRIESSDVIVRTPKMVDSHPVAWYSPELLAQDFSGWIDRPHQHKCSKSVPRSFKLRSFGACDVYSLGVTIIEMFVGAQPYSGVSPSLIMLTKVTGNETPSSLLTEGGRVNLCWPSEDNQDAIGFFSVVSACLQFQSLSRPSARQLMTSPWIKYGLSIPLTEQLIHS